jgi:hypothetical protein
MIGSVFISMRAKLRKEMNDVADDLATGSAEDYARYQRMVGKIEGLAIAERVLLDTEADLKHELDVDDAA